MAAFMQNAEAKRENGRHYAEVVACL
jgi:hypothetical protein